MQPDGLKLVKIGRAAVPENRLANLQTASPVPLRLVGVLASDIEKSLHRAFRQLRRNGEWFEFGGKLLEYVEALTRGESESELLRIASEAAAEADAVEVARRTVEIAARKAARIEARMAARAVKVEPEEDYEDEINWDEVSGEAWAASIIGTGQAAVLLGVTPEYVAMLCKRGKILAVQIGREWAVNRAAALKRAAAKRKAKP